MALPGTAGLLLLPAPLSPIPGRNPLTDTPNLQFQTVLAKQRLLTAPPARVSHTKNITRGIFGNWWQTGPPTLQISFFYSARKCKNLRDQTKHSQMSLSPGLSYPVSILFSSKKSSSAAQILHGIHLRIFPRAKSLNSTMESILCLKFSL